MPIASIDTVLTYTTGDQTSQNLENLTNNKHLVAIYLIIIRIAAIHSVDDISKFDI